MISTIVAGTVYNNPNVGVDVEHESTIPSGFRLFQNYPNPFNAGTQICFEIPSRSHVRINILNVQGQLVKSVINKLLPTGKHTISFDASDLPSGIYFIHMKTKVFSEFTKMILLK
ncbi:T9SS type A sorting domain-containing protein [bacterium]